MKRKIISLWLLTALLISVCFTPAMAVEEGFNPYEKKILASDSDYCCYTVNASNFCGGGGYAAFYNVDFGDLGAKSVKLGFGWSGTTKGPITVRLYDGDPDTVKEDDKSGWIHDAETGKVNLGEVIAELPSGQTGTDWSKESVVEVPLTRTITGKHGIYVMSSANLINAYSIQFVSADEKTVTPPVYEENFDDEPASDEWNSTKTAGALSGVHMRTGKAYYMYGNGKNIAYTTNENTSTGKAYEVWMYYGSNSPENKQIILNGKTSDGTEKSATVNAHWAYSDYRVNNGTTGIAKSGGWHKFVIDCTDAEATKFYIDGAIAKTLPESDSLASVSSVVLENGADGSSVWFDDFKIYSSYSDVPSSRSEMTESILFDSGAEVSGAAEIKASDGGISIKYQTTMQNISADNFKLYKKEASADDSTYAMVENGVSLLSESTSKLSKLSLPGLESVKKYRLYMTGLKSVNGSVMDDDFVEFTTGNVSAREGILVSQDFNSALGEGWTATKFSSSGVKAHSLPSSYFSKNAGSSLAFDTSEYPNSIYDVWFYYGADSYEHKEIRLKDANGNWISLLAHSSSSGYILKNNGAITYTKAARDEGWHRAVIDCVDTKAVKFWVDGVLVGTLAAPFDGVSVLSLENGVDNTKIWYDDLKIYDSTEYSPSFTSEIIKSVKFDSGISVNNAQNVGVYDGSVNIEYVSAMNNVSANNFVLYKKGINADDSEYAIVEDGISLTNDGAKKSVISVVGLEPSAKYRLSFIGLTPAEGNAMADDFVEFTTADSVELSDGVVKSIRFDNGIAVPTKGIPSEMCGDLTVTFKEKMNTDTLNDKNITLERVTSEGSESIAYTAEASETEYVIDCDSMALKPSETYRLTFKTNILTDGRNYLSADEVYEFSTSSDAIRQEPSAADDFENGVSWTIVPAEVGDKAHGGAYALSLNGGETAVYKDTVVPNGVYELWLYDTLSDTDEILFELSGGDESVTLGIKNGESEKYWLTGGILVGKRSEGWHRFIIDFTNPDKVGYYVDDVRVAERAEEIGEITKISVRADNSSSTVTADDFKIWNLMDYQVISRVRENNAFICDENYNALLEYNEGDEVYIALNVDNQQENEQAAVLVVGEYENSALKNVIIGESKTVAPTESTILRASYTIPSGFSDRELKAFCWSSISGMKPLMPESNPKAKTAVILGNDNSYISGLSEYLTQKYGEIKVVDSTTEGKGSDFGAKYFDAYAGSNDPDILIVDYAAIDDGNAEIPVKKHMEQIVRSALELPKKPKIAFINKTANKWHNEVAGYYGIPVINLSETASEDCASVIGNALTGDGFLTDTLKKEAGFDISEVSVETNIMSFNICVSGSGENVWENRKEAVIGLLNNSGADVISMVEVTPAQYEYIKENINEKYDVIHYIREDATTQAEGLAIAYNTEMFDMVSNDRFWLSDTPDKPSLGWDAAYYRICVNGLLKHKETGGLLDIYAVHLDHVGQQARENGMKLVTDRAMKKGHNAAVMGDFNFAPSETGSYNAIADSMQDCMTTAPVTETGSTYQDFGNKDSGYPIDYIFVSEKNMSPLTFDIVTEKWTNSDNEEKFYSDHYPIQTKVEVTYEID